MAIAGLWTYGDWRHVATGCTVLVILFIAKLIFTVTTLKTPQNRGLYAPCSNQEERRREETPAHTINVQTVTDGTRGTVTSGRRYTSLILVVHAVNVSEACQS